ncbi:MAG: hypothetical protein ABIN97_20885 [Ginsengibacter sp.]
MAFPRLTSHNRKEILIRKQRAYFLIAIEGYSQKEAANEISVSLKTMCKWAKEGEWKRTKNSIVERLHAETGFTNFLISIKDKVPNIYKQVKELWSEYLDMKNHVKD